MNYKRLSDSQKSIILDLRFGPAGQRKATKLLLGYAQISKIVSAPAATVRSFCLRYFSLPKTPWGGFEIGKNRLVFKNSKSYRESKNRLSATQISWIINHKTLRAQVGKSIKERAVLFERQFPGKTISPWQLRQVYKDNMVKKKTINMTHMPKKGNDGRYDNKIVAMRNKVQYAIDRNRRILYLDEVCFTKQSNKRTEWSEKRNNIFIPCESMKVPYTAVIAAIAFD